MGVQVMDGTIRIRTLAWFATAVVLSVVCTDRSLKQALNRTYKAVNRIRFDGAFYRRDIGQRVLKAPANRK